MKDIPQKLSILRIYESQYHIEEDHIEDTITFLWSSYKTERNHISIPSLVENNSERLRREYLNWLEQIEKFIDKETSIDSATSIYPGLSLWELSALKEKSLWKTPEIYAAVRFLALRNYFHSMPHKNFSKVFIKVSDRKISKILKSWLEKNYVVIEDEELFYDKSLKEFYDLLPEIIKSLVFLVQHKWKNFFFNEPVINGKIFEGSYSFFSYLLLFKFDELRGFESKYWAGLDKLLPNKKNWIHLYTKSKEVQSTQSARKLVNSIKDSNSHIIFESFQTRKVILKAIKNYIKFYFSFNFPSFDSINKKIKTEINFSCLFERHWNDSIYGKNALNNLILIESIKSLVEQLPDQKAGFYLLENQSWEKILNYFWHTNTKGPLFGVQHNAVCFWDLRHTNFAEGSKKDRLIHPTKILLNGQSAFESYISSGWQEDQLEKVEALRYLYLEPMIRTSLNNSNFRTDTETKILFLGDYSDDVNLALIEFCKKLMRHLGANFEITFKSHPASNVDFKSLIYRDIKITNESLDRVARKFDLIITSNPTTASVELLSMGARVFVHIDGKFLNLSPLKGYNINFISENNIDEIFSANFEPISFENFFYTDKKLKKWKALLYPLINSE